MRYSRCMKTLDPTAVPAPYQALGDELRRRFVPEAAAGLDHTIDLDMQASPLLRLRVRQRQLSLKFMEWQERDQLQPQADARFYFPDLATGRALLLGEANAIDAFMQGAFRADGYLMLSFALMAMFNSTSLPPTPND